MFYDKFVALNTSNWMDDFLLNLTL